MINRDRSTSCSDEDKIRIDLEGTKPTSGKIKITNGSIELSYSNIVISNYKILYNIEKNIYEATEILCTSKKVATLGNIPNGNYAFGDEYTCELGDNDAKTFFVLETNEDNVSLIMDKNIDSNGKGTVSGNTVTWCKSESNNSCAADGAKEYLKNSTIRWSKLTNSQISLPTAQQLVNVSEKEFDGSNNVSGLLTWLSRNLNPNSGIYGYWTSTPDAINSTFAFGVYYDGSLNHRYVLSENSRGVRPVITISKSQLG